MPALDESGLRRVRDVRPFPFGPSTFESIWEHRQPESLAVIDGDRQWTTAELRDEVDRVARCLVADGLARGDRVAWVLGNDIAGLVSLLATVRAGGVWLGVSRRSTAAERASLERLVEPTMVLTGLPTGDPDVALPSAPTATDIAALAVTSGTTGPPKAVVHIQQQLLYPAAAAIATEALDTTTRVGTPLPLATLNILLLGPLTALACGGVAVLMHRTDASGFTADVELHGVTRALVVPTIVHDVVAAGIDPDHLSSLDRLVMGGSGFDRERAVAAREQLGVPLVASYGLSEAPTGVARMPVGEPGATPLPGIDLRVEADGEITLAPSTGGPWAHTWQGALGYLSSETIDEELWRSGRMHTGDVGVVDEQGRLLVHGRASEMINRGGATIAPGEVERALLALDGVQDAAVFGVDDERLGQTVAAAVVGRDDGDDLAAALRDVLSGYKVPQRWLVLDELPRNANGKVRRDELLRLLG